MRNGKVTARISPVAQCAKEPDRCSEGREEIHVTHQEGGSRSPQLRRNGKVRWVEGPCVVSSRMGETMATGSVVKQDSD